MGGGDVVLRHWTRADLVLRAATKADLDTMVEIVQAAFPDDPGCNYKFPYRAEHPHDFRKWTRVEYEEYLEQPKKFAVLLVTAPVASGDIIVQRPVAIGVWDIAVNVESKGGDRGITERRDANAQHMRVYAAAISRGFKNYLARYGSEQLHLWMLMTHPDFRRRGAGTMLCNWGQDEAVKRGGWSLTVMASPLGRLLYEHLGYQFIGTETAQTDGEKEKVVIDSMSKLLDD
ncbi:acyl-CoA N-acyltransferase [Nemania abortiva]|nr:acyl-CoA N-acyltransferase [Nemania abortiva]